MTEPDTLAIIAAAQAVAAVSVPTVRVDITGSGRYAQCSGPGAVAYVSSFADSEWSEWWASSYDPSSEQRNITAEVGGVQIWAAETRRVTS